MSAPLKLQADADLSLSHASGSRLRLQLQGGEGRLELSDARLLRCLLKRWLSQPRERQQLQRLSRWAELLQGGIDLSVRGRRIARLDSGRPADALCRRLGLTGCLRWPCSMC